MSTCAVNVSLVDLGLEPVAGVVSFTPIPETVGRVGNALVAPAVIALPLSAAGTGVIDLVPGLYSVTVAGAGGWERHPAFAVTVPVATIAYLAQLIQLPPPATLNAAEQAVLDAQAARDVANLAAANADADRIAAQTANTAAQVAKGAAEASEDAAAASAAAASSSATAASTSASGAASDRTATAADRTQTGLDRTAAATSATASAASQAAAAASASAGATSAAASQASRLASESARDTSVSAKAASEAARDAAQISRTAAETAETAAETAQAASQSAKTASETARDAAAASATSATGSATTSTANAASALSSKNAAAASETAAASSATAAASSASAASTSASVALTDANRAVTARTGAEAAQVSASGSAATATTQATAANLSAGQAAGSAASASAIYGSTAAQQTAVATAQAQASLAQGYAASAASVVQQDLSGVTAQALHRSPNAVTSMFIYDTSKDSDGGAWTEKCQHTSWWNEPIMGKWLGAQLNELQARSVNATLGTEMVSSPYAIGGAGWSASSTSISRSLGSALTNGNFTSVAPIVSGKTYVMSFTASALSGGTCFVVFAGDTAIAAINRRVASAGNYRFVFTASNTSSPIFQAYEGTDYAVTISDISVREVTALTTASSDYFQLTTDGKFYRLWKNLLSSSRDPFASVAGIVSKADAGIPAPTGDQYVRITELSGTSSGKRFFSQNLTTFAGRMVFSFYAKENTGGRWISFRENTTTGFAFAFQPSTGTVSTYAGGASTSNVFVETVSAGVYRVSFMIDFTSAASRNFSLDVITGAGQSSLYAGDGVSGYDITSVQLEIGSTATTYEPKTTIGTTSEIFRGNKRDFPRLAGIVAEAANVTIYDLTEPGRPMWMRFAHIASNWSMIGFVAQPVSSVAALNSRMVVGCSGASGSLHEIDFGGEAPVTVRVTTNSDYLTGFIANRITASTLLGGSGSVASIANRTVNAIAMTVLPDAPVDPVTGLRVPTIAVATGGGVSIIKHNGTVESRGSYAAVSQSTVSFDGYNVVIGGIALDAFWGAWVWNFQDGSVQPYGTQAVVKLNNNNSLQMVRKLGEEYASPQGAAVNLLRANKTTPAKALLTRIAQTFNTGWMAGDIRRAFLSDTEVGSVTGPSVIPNGDFSSADTFWTLPLGGGSATVVAGQLHVTASGAFSGVTPPGGFLTPGLYRVEADLISGTGRFEFGFSGDSRDFPNFDRTGPYAYRGYVVLRSDGYFVPTLRTSTAGATTVWDNFKMVKAVDDRSYKAKGAVVNGTLTRAQLASGTSLVGYSGWSAANYLQEPYSADLEFGTGEWSASAWVKYPYSATGPTNYITKPEQFSDTAWTSRTYNGTWTADQALAPDGMMTADLLTGSGTVGSTGFDSIQAGLDYGLNEGVLQTYSVCVKAGTATTLFLSENVSAQSVRFNLLTGAVITSNLSASSIAAGGGPISISLGDGWFRLGWTMVKPGMYGITSFILNGTTYGATVLTTGTAYFWGAKLNNGVYGPYIPGKTAAYLPTLVIANRAHTSGSMIQLGVTVDSKLTATAFDGTTTRTVTTASAYNTNQWLKAEACYTTDGSLDILVNGREVAVTRGTPLLTLNNASAPLTIGNSFAADAPFPGSIALLKIGATVPTADQSVFMYEQEKQMFRENAASVLPDTGALVDMAYDDATDRWVAISGTNESYWAGLVRTSVTPVPAGSYTKIVAGSGLEMAARVTTNPGVDVTIPAYGLREELVKRAESAAKLSKEIVVYDYVGGFTATTAVGSTAITSAAGLTYPTSYIGARITGTGIPANTTILGVSGTTIYISAPATAAGTGVSMTFLDFILPIGMEAKAVMSAGLLRQEGATKDYTRLFDGFAETIRFAVAPGATAWVQVQATKGTVQ